MNLRKKYIRPSQVYSINCLDSNPLDSAPRPSTIHRSIVQSPITSKSGRRLVCAGANVAHIGVNVRLLIPETRWARRRRPIQRFGPLIDNAKLGVAFVLVFVVTQAKPAEVAEPTIVNPRELFTQALFDPPYADRIQAANLFEPCQHECLFCVGVSHNTLT